MGVDEIMYNRLGSSWFELFKDFILSERFAILREYIDRRAEQRIIYPDAEIAYKAFKLCPYEDAKVVILGQDPYHDGSANGLAFSTDYKLTPSLRVILETISEEYSQRELRSTDLTSIATQGVLLLNTALSVEKGSPGSHLSIWKEFMELVLSKLYEKSYLVWMLWGNSAKDIAKPNNRHDVLATVHPVSTIYNPELKFEPKFQLCNALLNSHGYSPITWYEENDDLPF